MNQWSHSPPHRLTDQGAYMVTSGTYQKAHFLNTPGRLSMFSDLFLDCVAEANWELHAWAILSNHYHFIASSPSSPDTLRPMISKLHTLSARNLNILDGQTGRKVWFQYFDSHITFANSYLPRLRYVHHNPAHHGVVTKAENYQWCSAAWFARTAKPAFRRTVESFKVDRLNVVDDFDVNLSVSVTHESGVKPPHSK
jgi:putative transposase